MSLKYLVCVCVCVYVKLNNSNIYPMIFIGFGGEWVSEENWKIHLFEWALQTMNIHLLLFSQFSSVAQSCPTLCDPMDCSMPGFPVQHNSQRLLKLMSIELVMPSNHLILHRPLLLLPSNFPSMEVFSSEAFLHIRWPKYWSFSFSIRPSNECSGLIYFRIDWLDLLAVQGTLKIVLQHHNLKAPTLQRPAFFIVRLSHPYRTTGKTIVLTIRTFFGESNVSAF